MYTKNFNGNIVLYDVDDTLVMWEQVYTNGPDGNNARVGKMELITIENGPYKETVCINQKEVDSLKAAKLRGHFVRVHSQGGQDWAEAVVKALKLEDYVDSIECKPKWYHDDIPADGWMKRFWNDPRNKGE